MEEDNYTKFIDAGGNFSFETIAGETHLSFYQRGEKKITFALERGVRVKAGKEWHGISPHHQDGRCANAVFNEVTRGAPSSAPFSCLSPFFSTQVINPEVANGMRIMVCRVS